MSSVLRGVSPSASPQPVAPSFGKPRLSFVGLLLFVACFIGLSAPACAQLTYAGGVVDLGSVSIGAPASTATVTFSVAAGTTATVTAVSAVTLGDVLQDFTVISQTCTGTLTGPTTCTAKVGFSPTARGVRRGALVVTIAGQPQLRVYLRGVGVGSQLVFSPDTATATGTVTPLQPIYYSPTTLVYDAAGNLYFNDVLNSRILDQSASGTLATVATLPGNTVSSMAISGTGTLYVTSQSTVYAVTPGGSPAAAISFTGAAFSNPSGIAVDSDGTLYIADIGLNRIIRSTPAGAASLLTLTGLATPLSHPDGLTIDDFGNLYIADTNNDRIVKVVLATGAATVFPITGDFLFNPYGVTTDASGAVYIADTGNRRVIRVPAGGGASTVIVTPNYSFSTPTAVVVASNGDLVVADNDNGLTRIIRSTPTTALTFPTRTPVGTADSTDSPKFAMLQNIGNAALQLVVPTGTATNPSTDNTAFTLDGSSTCPIVTSTTTAVNAQIASGVGCTYAVDFKPTAVGANTGHLNIVTRPTGATANVTSSVTLNGTGLNALDAFTITAPATAVVGTPVSFTVTAMANGAVSTTFTGPVTFTSTDPTATFLSGTTYTFTAADKGTHTFTAPASGIKFGTPGTYTIRVASGAIAAVSNNIVVSAVALADTLAFTITPTATIGVADAFTLTATLNGAPATAYRGTVTFSSTDPKATFPGGNTYTFTAADAGTHSFPTGVVFGTAGTFAVNATDGTLTATANVLVSPVVTASSLTFSITPTSTVGVSDAFTLTAILNGALATGYRGTVTFSSTDPKASFPGGTTYTFTAADNGAHAFPAGIVFGTAGTFTVNATDAANALTASATVVVSPAGVTATNLAFIITPTATIGVADAFTLTATGAGGAVATGYLGTVTFSSTDPKATFPGGNTYTFTAADNGTHAFPTGVVFGTAGTFAVNATDAANALTATANVVVSPVAVPATALAFTITPTATIGVADAFTLTATGAGGAVATGYRGTVTFSNTDPKATFPGGTTYTFTAGDAGTHTFPTGVVFGTVGTFAVNATDGTLTATANVVVSPVATAFTLAIVPTATVGLTDPFTLTATQNGVIATGYRGTVTFSSTDPAATFPGGNTYTFTAADNGVHAFPSGVIFGTVGTFNVTATDGTATGTASVVVSPVPLIASVTTLSSSANPTSVNGTTTFTATVSSATGTTPAPTGTVRFFDGMTLIGTSTLTGGVATLRYTFTTSGTHSITAVYAGDTIYSNSTSAAVTETVADFTLALATGAANTMSVLPGNSVAYNFTLTPTGTTTFLFPVTFSVTGLPPGATATFAPPSIPAGAGTTNLILTITTPAQARAITPQRPGESSPAPVAFAFGALGLALLPLLSRRRRRALRFVLPLLSVLALAGSTFGLTGCLADKASGYFGLVPTTYTLTITATSGSTSHATTVTLIEQ